MRQLLEQYIASKELSWSKSTREKERYRLLGLIDSIDGCPENLWHRMEDKNLKPYSRTTAWIRVSHFWEWGMNAGLLPYPNRYKAWKNDHSRLFKHVYLRKLPTSSLEETKEKLSEIPNRELRNQALCLLDHGMRIGEFNTWDHGKVIGKGSKPRKTFGETKPEGVMSYWNLYRALKKIGLKPHDLRKIRATDLAQNGLTEADLCYIFGWESFQTASSYLAPKKDLTLEALFKNSNKV